MTGPYKDRVSVKRKNKGDGLYVTEVYRYTVSWNQENPETSVTVKNLLRKRPV